MNRLFLSTTVRAATLAVILPVTGAIAAPAAAQPTAARAVPSAARSATLSLPAPTGAFPTGVTTRHLVDADRADPWVPERRRELMLSIWYPALPGDGPVAPYVSPAESTAILAGLGATGLPPEILSTTVTHSRTGARAAPKPGGRPLVVLSPGFTLARSSLTGLAEDLASRGYLVVGVDHTYEAVAVTFPDGRVTGCLICADADPVEVTASRALDVSFVLDSLAGTYDRRAVAMVGHSIGGAAVAATMLADRRVDVGVNIDGTFRPAVTGRALDRPFLLLGAEVHGTPGRDDSWLRTWPNLTDWRRWLSVTGTEHLSFTDYAVLADQLGLPMQPLAGVTCMEITRAYVAATVDRHLRHRFSPLLTGPSPRYPQVLFHHP